MPCPIKTDISRSATSHRVHIRWSSGIPISEAQKNSRSQFCRRDREVEIKIPAPTGRLNANQMADKPYTRFGITDDAQSQIVPTLIRRSGNPVECTC